MATWKAELERAAAMDIQHISAYCLTVEPKTALGHWVRKGKAKPVDEDAANQQFEIMVKVLADKGFEQYEVSNFAKNGVYSQHNTAYWQGIPYIGLGPSAHGYNGFERSWNVANNAQYIKKITSGELPLSTETLSPADRFNEWLMTGLRTRWGVDIDYGKTEFGFELDPREIENILEEKLATMDNNRLRLTRKGMFLADGIAAGFFVVR
jgi:oxygen-independent coproporphyrinogen-3 oxidase